MANSMPGVKVGPLDPESTSQFGTVSQTNSARQLIRLHTQMNPPALRRALSRPRDDERTLGLDIDEVREYLAGLERDNGDPLIPEGAVVEGAAVRGDRVSGPQIITFTYRMPSGRVAKWHAPYNGDVLPASYDAGAELARVRQMKDRGVVAFDTEGTTTEIQRRQLAELRRENAALRQAAQGRGSADDAVSDGSDERYPDTRDQANRDAELEQLRRANQEMSQELVALRSLQGQGGGGQLPTGGLENDLAAQSPGEQEPPGDSVASADPPFEGYDELKADQAVAHVRHEDRTDEERQAILEYERTHANRKSVVAAAEQSLGSGGASD